ncbi:hypothetical protein LCGC14_1977320, partial [marine sediment metagenome]
SPADGTNGMQNTGVVAWEADDVVSPAWVVHSGNYRIRIKRTRGGSITSPIEDKVQIADVTVFEWDKLGNVTILKLITDTIAERTAAAGVTIDGVLLKDGVVAVGDVAFDDSTSDPLATAATTADGTENSIARKDHVHPIGVGTTRGDLLVWNSTPVASRLALGAAGTVLIGGANDPSWSGSLPLSGTLTVGTINEVIATVGVTIEGVLLKDSNIVVAAIDMSGNLNIAGELIFDRANAISTLSKSRQVAGDQFLDIDFDGLTASEDARVRFFRSTTTAGGDDRLTIYVPGTSTVSMEFYANTGRMALPVVGGAAGLLIGGDVQLYRSTANVLYIPDSVTITGTELVDTINEFTANEGVEVESVVLRDGILWGQTVYPELGIGDQIELTLSGNEITDKTRALAVGGDGRVFPDSSFGIWEATENLVTNGGFETNVNGWGASLANTIAVSTEQAKFGAQSALSTFANHTVLAFYAITLTAELHAASAWLYIPSDWDGGIVRIRLGDFGGATGTSNVEADMTLTDQWQRLAGISMTIAGGDLAGNLLVEYFGAAPTVGRTIYTDGVQIEKQPIDTPYVETDGGTITRAAARVQAPASVLDETQGWWAVRVRVGWDYDDAPYNLPYLCSWQDDATHRISFYYDEGGSIWVILNWTGAGADAATSAAQTFSAGDLITIIGKWEAADLGISVDGAAFVLEGDRDSGLPGLAAATFDIGSQVGGDTFDGDFLWVAAGKGTLTDADARLINACGNTPPNRSVLPTV